MHIHECTEAHVPRQAGWLRSCIRDNAPSSLVRCVQEVGIGALPSFDTIAGGGGRATCAAVGLLLLLPLERLWLLLLLVFLPLLLLPFWAMIIVLQEAVIIRVLQLLLFLRLVQLDALLLLLVQLKLLNHSCSSALCTILCTWKIINSTGQSTLSTGAVCSLVLYAAPRQRQGQITSS